LGEVSADGNMIEPMKLDLKETGYECVDWIELAVKWVFVNKVVSLQVP